MSFELSWHRGKLHLKQTVKWWGGGDALEKKLWKPKLPEKAHFGSGQCPKDRDKEKKKKRKCYHQKGRPTQNLMGVLRDRGRGRILGKKSMLSHQRDNNYYLLQHGIKWPPTF